MENISLLYLGKLLVQQFKANSHTQDCVPAVQ